VIGGAGLERASATVRQAFRSEHEKTLPATIVTAAGSVFGSRSLQILTGVGFCVDRA
jgi:hypothetical protein